METHPYPRRAAPFPARRLLSPLLLAAEQPPALAPRRGGREPGLILGVALVLRQGSAAVGLVGGAEAGLGERDGGPGRLQLYTE